MSDAPKPAPQDRDDLADEVAELRGKLDAAMLRNIEYLRRAEAAEAQATKLADGLHVWRDQCMAAEGKVERVEALLDKWQHTPDHYCCERCQLAAALASDPTTHESEA